MGFPGSSEVKASACNVGDLSSIPGSGRSPGEGNGNPLQYSCLENSMDGRAWWATVHGVSESRTRLSDFTHSLTHSLTQVHNIWDWIRKGHSVTTHIPRSFFRPTESESLRDIRIFIYKIHQGVAGMHLGF